MSLKDSLKRRFGRAYQIEHQLGLVREALGRIEARQLRQAPTQGLRDNEFRVFSQWGEDGIIQHLVAELQIGRSVFVEFGVENYLESSTRFLLVNDNWSGLVIDGSEDNIAYIRNDPIYWQHNLKAECAFVTRENINELLLRNGVKGEIGLLSVDIDGNDYWVWEAIDCISPCITVVEYNARFGPDDAVTIPYDAKFVRSAAHPSMLYFGASLAALVKLGTRKGYAFVGCNSAGNNAFFVRRDRLTPRIRAMTAAEGFVANQFREMRGADGELNFEPPQTGQVVPAGLPLVRIE
jgi:hypothetical protein